MNKLKIGLSVLAVLIGAGSVLASNAATSHSNDPTYDWITYDQSGNQTGTFSDETQEQMKDITKCPVSGQSLCAEAFDDLGNPVPSENLRYQ